jgi:transcriptional regulator with XRE-family HTH domain
MQTLNDNQNNAPLRLRVKPKRIGPKLRAIRKHLGLSQTGMVNRMKFPGDYGRISEYERGKRIPTIVVLLAYARAGKVPLEQIVDDELDIDFDSCPRRG